MVAMISDDEENKNWDVIFAGLIKMRTFKMLINQQEEIQEIDPIIYY
jgi:hypothetical protein